MFLPPACAKVPSAALLTAVAFACGLVVGAMNSPLANNRAALAVPAAAASPVSGAARSTSYPADLVRVIDGDTFEARIRIWPGLEVTTKVRLRGIDAPELTARCAEELARAQAARDALTAMLAPGDLAVAAVALDKYGGRVVASASSRATADVSAALLAAGLARPYRGGRRESWC